MNIPTALAALDPENDDHWTREGLPVVAVVQSLAPSLTLDRQAITEAAPAFTRDSCRTALADKATPAIEETGTGTAEPEPPNVATSSNQDAEPGAPAFDDLTPEEKLVAELDEQAAVKMDEIRAAEDVIKKGQEMLAEKTREHDQLMFEREQAMPALTHQESIKAYIDSQNKIRAERVARRNAVLKGLTPDDLRKGSPLDAAHARKRQRGTRRPERLPMQRMGG